MLSQFRHGSHSFVLLACSILLAMLLAACGGGGTTSSPTPTPTPTLAPSPTPSATPTTSSNTYTGGTGYTITYPAGWKVDGSGNRVTFADATGAYSLTIGVAPNPNGLASADFIANTALTAAKAKLTNSKDENVSATTTVGGDSWVQKSASGTTTSGGQSVDLQFVVIGDNHPASSPSTNSFTIVYITAKQLFATASSTYFQPMLQSFKFTS